MKNMETAKTNPLKQLYYPSKQSKDKNKNPNENQLLQCANINGV